MTKAAKLPTVPGIMWDKPIPQPKANNAAGCLISQEKRIGKLIDCGTFFKMIKTLMWTPQWLICFHNM